jgi:hypothetical protein
MGGLGKDSAIQANACQAANGIGISMGRMSASVGDDPEEFLVGIDVRPGAFERDGARQCRLQRYCDRRRYIFDISWLQSRSAAAKHRKEWMLFEKLDDSREESVVWPEHHGRADEERVGEGSPDCQFPFATLANIKRLRAGIGTNS